jgi:TRAP-type C4-dicarboxylate transport system substrate-binding protein
VNRLVVLLISLLSSVAVAEPRVVLRMATVAPEGTSWVREVRSLAAEIEAGTHGSVSLRWYVGGVAGDEREMGERLARGQLDGVGSGGMLCQKLLPSLAVGNIPGMIQTRDEAAFVMHQLTPLLREEAHAAGYELLGTSGIGPVVIFTRNPIRSMAELRATRLWEWDLDEYAVAAERQMGLRVVPLSLDAAAPAYAEKRVDGFEAVPTGALAFQWSSQARYVVDLRMRFLTGCLLIANRAFDRLSFDEQQVLRSAFAKLDVRLEDLSRRQDELLLGGLFKRQGLTPIPVDGAFRSEFFHAARTARERIQSIVPKPVFDRVQNILADYRSEHDR